MGEEKKFIFTYTKPHHFLKKKNCGASKELLGDVVIINFFADDAESHWTESAKAEYTVLLDKALHFLMNEARRYGANLRLRRANGSITVPFEMVQTRACGQIRDMMRQYQMENASEFQQYYEQKYNIDEAPVVIALNKPLRSFASSMEAVVFDDEYSVIGRHKSMKFSEYTIAHEILHQFGAKDFYYPKKIKSFANLFLTDSVMDSGKKVDDLTAYLVGWTKKMTVDAFGFLTCTESITDEEMIKARQEEQKDVR